MPPNEMPVSGIRWPFALGRKLEGLPQLLTARRDLKKRIDDEEDKPQPNQRDLAVLRLDFAIVKLHIKLIDVGQVQNGDRLVEEVTDKIKLAEELKKLGSNPNRNRDDETRIAEIKDEIEGGSDEVFKEIFPGDLNGI